MDPKREAILKLISEDPSLENHFFKTKKNPIWFNELKKKGYFKPDKNPPPEQADKEGYFKIPQWNVLDYLEKISLQLNEPSNEQYIEELLQIIESVTNYEDDNGNLIDNYRTWWYFVKIIINIPNNKVPIEVLHLIPTWLNSRFGTSLVDAEIATKLLPKFLRKEASPEDIKKGEIIVDYITNIKWVSRRGVFKDTEEIPTGVVDDHWLIESFFDKGIAQLLGEVGSEEIIYKLANKLKDIFRKHRQTNWIDFDEDNKTYRFLLDHQEDYHFTCMVGVYEKKEQGGEKALLESFKVEPEVLFKFEINTNGGDDFSKKVAAILKTRNIPEKLRSEINDKSKDLYKNVLQDYSYIWLKNLNFQSKDLHDIKHILLATLAVALLEKAEQNVESTKKIIIKFLSDEYPNPTFTRLIILIISKQWDIFKDTLWTELFNEDEPILETPDFEQDLRSLFKENVSKFTEEEKQLISKIIDKGPQKYLPEKNPEGYVIYWKQRWYGSLKADSFFSIKYDQIKALADYDDTLEDNTEGKWVGVGDSPFTTDEMLKSSNDQIAAYLLEFKEKDKWEDRSTESLSNSLEEAVKNKPDKFAEDLEPFMKTGFYYVYHILSGFEKAWENKTSFDWDKVLTFIERYIDRPDFWKNKLKVAAGFYDADNRWVIGIIGDLIKEGTRNDDWSAPSDSFELMKRIFSLIASKANKDEKDSDDFPTHVLNCGLGKVITGLLYLMLRIARLDKQNNIVRWDEDIKKIFETFLSRDIFDSFTILGEYIANFYYLDSEWTKEQITKIKKTKDKILWEAFMSGYLTSNRVNLNLYKLMEYHYKKGLSYDFKEKILNGRLIEHIAIGYLNGQEELEGEGLLGIIWRKWDSDQIDELINYFWYQREALIKENSPGGESELNAEMEMRIIDFWREVHEKLQNKTQLTKNDKSILSRITKLTIFLPELNGENFQWLMLAAPYAEDSYNSPYLIECMNNLKEKGNKIETAKKLGQIFVEILKSFKPYYDEVHIRSIVEHLYQTEDDEVKRLANEICNEYARAGMEIVSDIYKKYNA